MIYRKVYTSRVARPMTVNELDDILNVSRINNSRDGLSGMLVAHNQKFFQVIEGPLGALEDCYARIENDTRHTKVLLLAKGKAETRSFPDWKMGFARPDALNAETRDSVFSLMDLERGTAGPAGDNDRVQRLVRNFMIGAGRTRTGGGTIAAG